MRYPGTMVLLVSFLGVATVASADPVVDCSRRSLANVVDNIHLRTSSSGSPVCVTGQS